jgi:hypothetical protein
VEARVVEKEPMVAILLSWVQLITSFPAVEVVVVVIVVPMDRAVVVVAEVLVVPKIILDLVAHQARAILEE